MTQRYVGRLEGAGGSGGGEVTALGGGLHFGVTECSRAVVLALPNALHIDTVLRVR